MWLIYTTTIYKTDNQQGPTVYSTGNSTQNSVITYMGKECEKEYIYMCVYIYIYIYIYTHTYTHTHTLYSVYSVNHFAVYLKLTQHCKSTILQ